MGIDSLVQARLRSPRAQTWPQLGEPAPKPRAPAAVRALRPAQRYQIREEAGARTLVCVEAPTLAVSIERGRCVRASEAHHAPPGTIFLDGAAECAPFADPVRGIYNLDHHEGCVRAFTLSTCEQAMALLLRGLDLRKREWNVFANDADLDVVLAIWVLLNHHRLAAGDGEARAQILPLLRLEGAIDAHGLAHQEFCALPPGLLDETRRRMERLRDCERGLRGAGRWQKVDLLEYTRERLEQIDAFVYPQDAFADLVEIEELGRAPLEDNSVAVACRAHVGIYEVERQLARFHGRRLGLLVLRQREGVYTLRQTDPELPANLESLYAHLNRVDPAARAQEAERRWGGSHEIGGSPRAGGSKLAYDEILAACRHVYARPPLLRRLAAGARACAVAVAVPFAALAAVHAPALPGAPTGALAFGLVLAFVAACCFGQAERRVRGLQGWRWPSGLRWLAALPFGLAGALASGVWMPAGAAGAPLNHVVLASLLCASGAELLFRGYLHGRLTACAAPRAPGRPALATSVLLSGLLFAAVTAALTAFGALAPSPFTATQPSLAVAGALLFGLAAGAARESSGSVAAPFALHVFGAAALLAVPSLGIAG
jgi:membrane protease YdiL (CAAX protease family)